jgi:hypothetical protein
MKNHSFELYEIWPEEFGVNERIKCISESRSEIENLKPACIRILVTLLKVLKEVFIEFKSLIHFGISSWPADLWGLDMAARSLIEGFNSGNAYVTLS